jgi:transcriptional regulator with XRE-family HTH domain
MMYSIQGIAKSIKVARNKKGLSQRALSAKTGVPQSHISKIENGMVDLQISSLIEISRALDLELVLVSTTLLPAVEALHSSMNSGQVPAYRLTDEEGNEND